MILLETETTMQTALMNNSHALSSFIYVIRVHGEDVHATVVKPLFLHKGGSSIFYPNSHWYLFQ